MEKVRLLAVADVVQPQLYNNDVAGWLGPLDLLVSCGDLPPYYLDFLMSTLNVPAFHVIGNHCYLSHDPVSRRCEAPGYQGYANLNARVVEHDGLFLAGVEGSPLYSRGPHQYSEQGIELNLLKMMPGLALNRARTGRYLDILVTHAPPRGIHDNPDPAHRGWSSLIPFIDTFKPALVLHGHTHRYNPMLPARSTRGRTEIVNAFGHVLLELTREDPSSPWQVSSATPQQAAV